MAQVIAGRLYAGPEVDIWSAGCILFALLAGRFADQRLCLSAVRQQLNPHFNQLLHSLHPARAVTSRSASSFPVYRHEGRQHAAVSRQACRLPFVGGNVGRMFRAMETSCIVICRSAEPKAQVTGVPQATI